ncbi:Armadillo repeat-containing protein [Dirofilaria immitis]
MDTSCQGTYPTDQHQQLTTLYDPQIPTTSYEPSSIPQAHHHHAGYYNTPMPHYPVSRVPYPSISMPNSPMRTQIKCESQQSSQQLLQPQYPEQMISTVDNRKIMNTQAWMNDHRFINYPQQQQQQYRTGSAPSSVMSMSRMSHVSSATEDMSMLSVNTQITELRQLADLKAQMHTSAPSSSSSCVENMGPDHVKFIETVNKYIEKITAHVNNIDKKVAQEMVRAVFMMATRNDFERADIDKLEKMMKTLIQRWLRQNDTEDDIVETILRIMTRFSADGKTKQIMSRWMAHYPDELLETFVRWMDPSQKSCKYALNTVHSLVGMVERHRYGKDIKEQILARTTRVMKEMDEKGDQYFINTYKSKQYVFDLVRRVFNGSDTWRQSFESKGGIQLLLRLLKKEGNESVVYRIARAIFAMVCSTDLSYAKKFVQLDGVKIISYLLANPNCSERVALDVMLCLRVVSDVDGVRNADLRETISRTLSMMGIFRNNPYFLHVGFDFLGNISATCNGNSNANKDFIADCGIIEGTINLLQAYCKRRDEAVVKNLISSMLWSLHVFTGGCSSPERNISVRKRLITFEGAPNLLLYELAHPVDLSSRLYVMSLFTRLVDADQLNHPPILFNISVNNNSLTDVLFEIIATTANAIESDEKGNPQKKLIIQKAYALLIALSNCNTNFGNAIRYSCSSYQIWDLLLGCQDADVVKGTIDFLMFVIKDEAVREQLSKDCTLVEAVRSLTIQMNENGSAAQFLLFHLTTESDTMVSFTPIL